MPSVLREVDCRPVEGFDPRRRDRIDRDSVPRPRPDRERREEQREQKRRSARIADPERAVCEIGHRLWPHGSRRDDRQPVEVGVEIRGANLSDHRQQEYAAKDDRADRVAQFHRHRDRVAAGLSECRSENLQDPEPKRDFRHLGQRVAPSWRSSLVPHHSCESPPHTAWSGADRVLPMGLVGVGPFRRVFEDPPGSRVDADLLGDFAALNVERVAKAAAARLALQLLIGNLAGMSFQGDLARLLDADLGLAGQASRRNTQAPAARAPA